MKLRDVAGCPDCQGPLDADDQAVAAWLCRNCGQRFDVQGRIPVLFRGEEAGRWAAFAGHYREARRDEGWQPLTPQQALALPYGRPPGPSALYWRVRRQSFCELMGSLARHGPPPAHGPAADLGAGNGWLSYRLAQLGYAVLAVDASRDADWGLGAAAKHYLPRVQFALAQGDLAHPPLQAGRMALIVLNASLHYVENLEGSLRRMACALKPGGRLVVLDTPIARQPRPGTGRGDRHLGRQELHQALLAAGLSPRWVPIRRGLAWWHHQARAWLRGEARFSFPMILADRRL
jgi:SAM-dependent methyltransferase